MAKKDVEYHVSTRGVGEARHGETKVFTDPKLALLAVANRAMDSGEAVLDVVVWSRAGARAHGGSDAVERYDEDPDATVFERYEFKCNAAGRVP